MPTRAGPRYTLPTVDEGASHGTAERPAAADRVGRFLWLGLLVALGIVAGVAVWLVVRDDDSSSATGASSVTVAQLTQLAKSTSRPIYWAGADRKATYELTQTNGDIFVRYLPAGVKAGDPDPDYLTVGTYAQPNALTKLKATARKEGAATFTVAGGGLAYQDKAHPTSVYIAYAGSAYQIEVYHPAQGGAMSIVRSGRIERVAAPVRPGRPSAVTEDQLEDLAAELGHAVYWAGREAGATYELTRTPRGRVY